MFVHPFCFRTLGNVTAVAAIDADNNNNNSNDDKDVDEKKTKKEVEGEKKKERKSKPTVELFSWHQLSQCLSFCEWESRGF